MQIEPFEIFFFTKGHLADKLCIVMMNKDVLPRIVKFVVPGSDFWWSGGALIWFTYSENVFFKDLLNLSTASLGYRL